MVQTPVTSPRQVIPLAMWFCRPPRRVWRSVVFWTLLATFTLGLNPSMTVNADSCVQLLTDHGLEDTTAWQTKSNDDFPLFSSLVTHTGENAAYLAGRNDAVDRLATLLELPAASTITLRFWWQLQSEEEQHFTDKLAILAHADQARAPQQLRELSSRNQSNQWQEVQLDLSAWAGETLQLQFLAQTDAELVTDFFIDDVTVVACPQSAAAK